MSRAFLCASFIAVWNVLCVGCGKSASPPANGTDGGAGDGSIGADGADCPRVGPDGVQCGSSLCIGATPVCCPTSFDMAFPFAVRDGTCVDATARCRAVGAPDSGVFAAHECDDSNECSGGTACCVNTDPDIATAQCKGQCERDTLVVEYQACHHDCECIDGSNSCQMSGKFAGFCCLPKGVHCNGAAELCCSGVCTVDDPNSAGSKSSCQ